MKINYAESAFVCSLLAISAFVFCTTPKIQALTVEGLKSDWRANMTTAFTRALSDPESFKNTGLFMILGYNPEQIKQMAEVTPRPATISIELTPSPKGNGAFEKIKVFCKNVRYYNLTIDHAVFEFPNVEVDPAALMQNSLVFRSVSEVGIETNVSDKDVLKVFDLFARARQLSNLSLKMNPEETFISGRVRKGWMVVAFQIYGKPELLKSALINFSCHRMVLNGMSLPRTTIRTIFDRINPVFDATKTWLKLNLDKLSVENGFVRTWATLRQNNAIPGK